MSSSRTQPPAKIDLTSPDLPRAAAAPPPTSPQQLEKSAARAMSSTDSWKPSLGDSRRQSYHKEDQKHALQMSGITASGISGERGFSEETH